MRIAEIAPPWLATPPSGYGGVELIVGQLADGLTDRGHDVTLFATGDSRTRARLEHVVTHAPGPGSINDIFLDATHAAFALRDASSFDLLHVHSPFAAMVGAAASGVPTVHTLHGPFDRRSRRLFTQVADRVSFVAISRAQRRGMPELRYAGVVHNGTDLNAYPFVGADQKEDYLLFLGRAAPEKGALRAALAARAAGMRLVMAVKVADPHERDHWEREVRPALPPGTEVLQSVSHREKCELLGRARAVLFPIDWEEPFGLVMTEAMACGTPVIATPRGSVPEVVVHRETGFIVPVEHYAEHAAAAIRHLDTIDPMSCRTHVERHFSSEAMVAGYERAFERVLSDPTTAGAAAVAVA